MRPFGIEEFTATITDMEQRQYTILALLQSRREEFLRTRLYPALSELVELKYALEKLLERRDEFNAQLPKTLTSIDWQHNELRYQSEHNNPENIVKMFELSEWALPLLANVIDEGKVLYDFVDENTELEGVGIMPVYTSAGYFFVPEHRARILHILKYELSLITNDNGRYRAIKTNEVQNITENEIGSSPEEIKLHLIEENKELPNPATFFCETDLDFPYNETILPVVKRKLMTQLVS